MKEYKLKSGLIFRVVEDQHPINPMKEHDNIGILACFHKKYDFTDKNVPFKFEDFLSWEEMEEYINKELKALICKTVFLMDHSGLSVKTKPFNDSWDSGRIGFVYVTKEKLITHGLLKEGEEMTEELKENLPNYIEGQIETWNDYLTGNVWGYQLVKKEKCNLGHEHEEVIDSCWGFYGDVEQSGIFENIPNDDEIVKEDKNG